MKQQNRFGICIEAKKTNARIFGKRFKNFERCASMATGVPNHQEHGIRVLEGFGIHEEFAPSGGLEGGGGNDGHDYNKNCQSNDN